jgi:peptide/nickel transport system permease protein
MSFLFKRLLTLLPVLLGVITLSFFFIHMIPGDPIEIMLGDSARPSDQAQLRQELGLDQPLLKQYGIYLGNLVRLNFGQSIQSQKPVLSEVLAHLPPSLELGMFSLLVSLVIGIPLGVVAAIRVDRGLDHLLNFFALVGLSAPAFWLAPLLIWFFSLKLNWFPVSERGSFVHLILPSMTLASGLIALFLKMTRASMLETMDEDYMRTAKAKGLGVVTIFFSHGLSNALFPLLTTFGMVLGSLITGTVIVETLFDWPGLGTLLFEAIQNRDYPMVQGCVLLISLMYVTINTLTDISYQYFHPKVKLDL